MKRVHSRILSALFFYSCILYQNAGLSSQPLTLTSANSAPIFGDSLAFQKARYVDPGPAGAFRFWDFSHIDFDGVPIVQRYVPATSLPINSAINPTSTINTLSVSNLACTSGSNAYYLKSDSTGLYEIGSGYYGAYIVTPYFPTLTPYKGLSMRFPFSYYDTASCHSSYATPYIGYTDEVTKLISDATGTLVTPCGTYKNVLRICRKNYKQTLSSTNTSHITYENTISYEWYSPGTHACILTISAKTTSSSVLTYPSLPPFHEYWCVLFNDVSKTPLGINDYSNPNLIGFRFQNPVRETLTIFAEDDGFYNYNTQIIDPTGKVLLSSVISNESKSIDISGIPAGVYLLQLSKTDGSVGRKKLIIEK